MENIIYGVYDRYTEAQRFRHELILAGYSSVDVEVASAEELQTLCDMPPVLMKHGFAVLLHRNTAETA